MSRSRVTAPWRFGSNAAMQPADTRAADDPTAISDDEPPSGILLRPEVLATIPRLRISRTDLTAMQLDPRAGFILSFIDGAYTVEMILDACSMRCEEALAILGDLAARGVIIVD
jgi:hypothetical protein